MRGTHIYTSYNDNDHPLHYLTQNRPQNRSIKTTPAQYYSRLYNSLPPATQGTSLRTHIHTHFTATSMLNQNPNSRLGRHPPPISREEETLSRENRVHLARLRCGHHPVLPSYTHRINLSDTDTCTLCNQAQGTLEHVLLHCPHLDTHRNQYNINALDHLWTRPVEVCNFLHDGGVLQDTRTSPPHTQ